MSTIRNAAGHYYTGNVYNKTAGALTWWQSALEKTRANESDSTIAILSDSTGRGSGSSPLPSTTDQNVEVGCWPSQLADSMQSRFGLRGLHNSFFGEGGYGSAFSVSDPRVTLGSGWTLLTTSHTPGGYCFADLTGTSTSLTFTPASSYQTDTLNVYALTYGGYADFVVSSNNVWRGSVSTSSSLGLKKFTVTRPLSADAWVIQKSSSTLGAELYILGMEALNSTETSKALRVLNFSISGSKITRWGAANSSIAYAGAITGTFAPDLAITCFTINDGAFNTTENDFIVHYNVVIEQLKTTSSVLMMTGLPSNTGTTSAPHQAEVIGWNRKLSSYHNVPLLDISRRWAGQAFRPDRGFYYDGVHGSRLGYADIARAVGDVIFSY